MGTYDGLPSLVAELRTMKSRIAEIERQTLGTAKQLAADASAAVDIVGHTRMYHYQGPADDGSLSSTSRTMATLPIDPEGYPLLCFVSIGLASQGTATSWVQVAVQLYNGGTALVERRVNLQANADIQHFGFTQGVPTPGSGERDISVVALVAARDTGQPDPNVGNVVLDVLRVGTPPT